MRIAHNSCLSVSPSTKRLWREDETKFHVSEQ